jgi:hypothetical protein
LVKNDHLTKNRRSIKNVVLMDLWKTTKNALLAFLKTSYESLKIILEVKKSFRKSDQPEFTIFHFHHNLQIERNQL